MLDRSDLSKVENIRTTCYEMAGELAELDDTHTLVLAADLFQLASRLRVLEMRIENPPTPPEDDWEGKDLNSIPF